MYAEVRCLHNIHAGTKIHLKLLQVDLFHILQHYLGSIWTGGPSTVLQMQAFAGYWKHFAVYQAHICC